MTILIKNGKVITADGIKYSNIYVENGVISEISESMTSVDMVIDANGHFLSPGFIDIHTHGGGGYDFMDRDFNNIIKGAMFHLMHGTTSIYPTTCTDSFDNIVDALGSIRKAKSKCDTIRGAHMESRYFNISQSGAQNPDYIQNPGKEETDYLASEFSDILSRISYAPELPGSDYLERKMVEYNIVLSAAHTNCTYDDMMRAYRNGNRLVTHLYSCTSTITRENGFRRLGLIETAFLIDDIDVEIIADGKHLPPELIKLIYKIKTDNHICLVTDSLSCAGTTEKTSTIGGTPCIIEDGVAKLPDRSAFAGSIATSDRLVRVCVKEAGIPIHSAVKMITKNPARVMGLDNKGELKPGFDADIVIFDDNVDIKGILLHGEVIKLENL